MRNKILLFIFIIIAITELYAEITNHTTLIYIVKPLLMASLLMYYYDCTKSHRNRFNLMISLGLFFSIGGDTFLMFDGSNYFIAGLGCFLITHLFYGIAFLTFPTRIIGFIQKKWWWTIPFLIYLVTLLSYLWYDLADMTIPVIVYGTIISGMAISAMNLKTQLPTKIFTMLVIGVCLFMFSDTIIALNKFKNSDLSIPNVRLLIMTSYIVAQFLIAESTIKASKT